MSRHLYYYYDHFPKYGISDNPSLSIAYAIFIILIILSSSYFLRHKGTQQKFLLICVPVIIVKIALIFLNENFVILKPKNAGNFALWLYSLLKSGNLGADYLYFTTFLVQTLINYPFFEIFGASRLNLLLTNALITSIAAIIAFFNLKKIYGNKAGFRVLFALSVYPAAINFSFFGLRDPFIYAFVILNIVYLIKYLKEESSVGNLFVILISLIACLSLRPELITFISIPYLLIIIEKLRNFYVRQKEVESKFFIIVSSFIVFFIPLTVVVFFVYIFAIKQIGAIGVSPIEIITTYGEYRYNRSLGEFGSGSHIVPPNIYYSLPWFGKWGLQTLGILILPFPWLINNLAKVLAFFDSIFILWFLVVFYKNKNLLKDKVDQLLYSSLKYSFVAGLLIMGVIVNNAGNAFRMRMAIIPFVLIMGAILMSDKDNKIQKIL